MKAPLKPGGIRALAYRVGCTYCGAQIGASCVSLFDHIRTHPHAVRVQRARVKAAAMLKGVLAPLVQVVETPAEQRVALPAFAPQAEKILAEPVNVEAQVHAILRLLAGEPTDAVTLVKARNLVRTAGIAATLEWAGLQFRVTLPDGREFLAPAADTLAKALGVTGRWA